MNFAVLTYPVELVRLRVDDGEDVDFRHLEGSSLSLIGAVVGRVGGWTDRTSTVADFHEQEQDTMEVRKQDKTMSV